jgi:hypothetical protein
VTATATAQPASITHVGTCAERCRNHAILMLLRYGTTAVPHT